MADTKTNNQKSGTAGAVDNEDPNVMNRTSRSALSTKDKEKTKKKMATVAQTLSFVWECGPKVRFLLVFGTIGGILNGLVYPALAYLFSNAFADISAASSEGLSQIRELAYTFMVVGTFALAASTVQGWCFEAVGYYGSLSFRLTWFKALLRQDPAFFDVRDVGGLAAQIGPNSNKYRRGISRKMGEGIQFFTTGVGGFVYAFYSSWQVALVILCVIPFVTLATMSTVYYNQTKGKRAAESYRTAGSVAYSTVASIRTVLSLNGIQEMVDRYKEATAQAYEIATSFLVRIGLANGSMLGSFLLLYAALALYGAFLLYTDVEETGCDPSDGVSGNETCDSSAPGVFGAMLGVAFAGQGISQFGNASEAFSQSRAAVYEALAAIERKPGAEEEIVFKDEDEEDDLGNTSHSRRSNKGKKKDTNVSAHFASTETGKSTQFAYDKDDGQMKPVKAVLPKYDIDSSSPEGARPQNITGAIAFKDVEFKYPTRPNDLVLKGLSAEIAAGQMVAFVGPSGGGKSTVVSLVERFYDPTSGSVELDGINLKDFNVKYLRSLIGYVGQEPTLFATSIRGNIRYGNPDATDEQIEEAAKLANAHDFITSFTDGYDTQVGDKGGQLSGGQKQRIAIARILVGNPKILLLDEATSALDAESELVVQDALDNILDKKKITTIVIAHRLSTIRNADVINVIVAGKVVERGTHEELMMDDSYYKKLVDKQEGKDESESGSGRPSRNSSYNDLAQISEPVLLETGDQGPVSGVSPHLVFRDITFSYPTRPKKIILNKFNLVVKQGQTVALVGPSGGGKSTTVGLIERFYDPNQGAVEYLGHDIKTLNVHWYRSQIGYVGQEPTLFNDTIAHNVAFGAPGVSQEDIEYACRQANAHDFIMEFADGYETQLGEKTALSGGQKQRIAIARALVRKPKVLLLDEATSALDNESEAIVQEAIDKLMASHEHTVIMIAHRLSTIREADKIALIADGRVLEFGSHDELMSKANGRYKRLSESSKRGAKVDLVTLRSQMASTVEEEEEENHPWETEEAIEKDKAFDAKRARQLASPDVMYMLYGTVGAVMAGGVFPMWGVLFSETINMLFRRVEYCENGVDVPDGFDTCQEYWDDIAEDMRDKSFSVALYWGIVVVGCLVGNILTFWGFGMASERLNKRVRDDTFQALLRQEIGYFDMHSVGSITSQLQDDAARLHAFSGEPLRACVVALSAVVTGITLSLCFMWPFALLAIGCVPLMGFATSVHMKQVLGQDIGADGADELNSPGGIIVETLLNMRTVSALNLEDKRFEDYERALLHSEPNHHIEGLKEGVTSGISMFVQQWINALQMWFGGWLLFTFPEDYEFNDFLISNFAVLFSLFGLGAAFQDFSDSAEVKASAGRIFYLLDRVSAIDPLSNEGKKLD